MQCSAGVRVGVVVGVQDALPALAIIAGPGRPVRAEPPADPLRALRAVSAALRRGCRRHLPEHSCARSVCTAPADAVAAAEGTARPASGASAAGRASSRVSSRASYWRRPLISACRPRRISRSTWRSCVSTNIAAMLAVTSDSTP